MNEVFYSVLYCIFCVVREMDKEPKLSSIDKRDRIVSPFHFWKEWGKRNSKGRGKSKSKLII